MPRIRESWSVSVILAMFVMAVGAVSMLQSGGFLGTANAAGSPDLELTKQAPATVLHGADATVTLSVGNPAGPYGYNLSFRDVLPAGVSYVAGSASIEPTIIADAPAADQTTLIWENVSDIAPGSTINFGYSVAHDTATVLVGDTYTNTAGAYANTDPRGVPDFDAQGLPSGDSTGSDEDSADTTVVPFEIQKTDPEAEAELLRGVHRHQTVYTLEVTNNPASASSAFEVVDFLPAGLEFLGCGEVIADDNTTEASTNPGTDEEYPGAGAIFPGNDPAAPDCLVPNTVETVDTDPDGPTGAMPQGIYTKVTWTGLGNLAAGGSFTIQYKAAVPIRENTLTWDGPGGAPGLFGDPTTGGPQGANLDNNNGAETSDEQSLANFAEVSGTNGGTGYTDDDIHQVSAEDFSIHKSVAPATIAPGQLSRWELVYETSEYRTVRNARIEDDLPDGLCPRVDPGSAIENDGNFDDENLAECQGDANDAPMVTIEDVSGGGAPDTTVAAPFTSVTEQADGSWNIVWDDSTLAALDTIAPSTRLTMFFNTTTRVFYQEDDGSGTIANVAGEPVLANDRWTNQVTLQGVDYVREVGGTPIDADEQDPGALADAPPEYNDPAWATFADPDASSADQSAGGLTIDKTVAQPPGDSTPQNCPTETYIQGPADGYGPGDEICYRLLIDYRDDISNGGGTVQDFTPPGTTYVPGSASLDPASVPATFDDTEAANGLLSWDLATQSEATQFIAYIKVSVTDAGAATAFDVAGNLMKFSYTNSFNEAFSLRDQADHVWSEPELTLLKGVRSVNGSGPNAPDVDDVDVQGGDRVTFQIDLSNAGNRPANDVVLLDRLPTGVACGAGSIENISNNGACLTDPFGDGFNYLQWEAADNIDLAGVANDGDPPVTATLTYDFIVPGSASPGTEWLNTAAVSQFSSPNNAGGNFTYYPEDDLDPANPAPNTDAASDTSDVQTGTLALDKTRTTEITGTPGNGGSQATIGEEITYTIVQVVPEGSTLFTPVTLTDTLGARVDYLAGTATLEVDTDGDGNADATPGNVALQNDATMDANNSIELLVTGNYANASNSGDDTFTITFTVQVLDVPANIRNGSGGGSTYRNDVDFSYRTSGGATVDLTDNVSTPIVEPNLAVAKAHNQAPAQISPFETVRYTLTATNPLDADGDGNTSASDDRVSTAYGVEILDTLPPGMFPVDGSGDVLSVGDCTVPGGGSAPCAVGSGEYLGTTGPSGEAQIRFAAGDIAPDATVTMPYDVQLRDAVAGETFANSALATGTSLPDPEDNEGERTTASTDGGGDPYAGYQDTAAATLALDDPTLVKSVDPAQATIGEDVQYTIAVTIPPGLTVPDATVLDTLPDGLDFVSFDGVTCASGCTTSTPVGDGTDIAPGVLALPAAPSENLDGTTDLGWWFGDIDGGPAESDERVFEITYTARIDDAFSDGADVRDASANLTNGAALYWTEGSGPDGVKDDGTPPNAPPPAGDYNANSATSTAAVDPREPVVALDKSETTVPANNGSAPADEGDVALGETDLTYTLAVTNSGNSPAYDIDIEDTPGAELTNVQLAADAGANLSTTWNTAAWANPGDTLTWTIPGPLAPGATLTISYTADLRPTDELSSGTAEPTATPNGTVINTAEIPRYLGVPVASYNADPGRYHEYGDASGLNAVADDTVTLNVLFPDLSIEKTTGAGGFPDVANADLFTPFTWRVVIANGADAGDVTGIDLVDVLPPNWTYVTDSAQFTHSDDGALGQINPTIVPAATGDTLTWTNIGTPAATLEAGEQIVVTFTATPELAAATNPGTVDNHVNTANAGGTDTSGSSEDADGAYEATGPGGGAGDTAEAHLRFPDLEITKTPDGDPIAAGDPGSWSIVIANTGDGAATDVVVNDTMPGDDPATGLYVEGVTYTAGDATIAPAPDSFSEDVSNYDATAETSPLTFAIGTIPAGASYTITVPFDANTPQLNGSRIDNLAAVTARQLPTAESDGGHLLIGGTPVLVATKSATPADSGDDANHTIVEPTDQVDYEIAYQNTGNDTATGVVVTDDIPANSTYVAGSAASAPAATTEFLVSGVWEDAEPANAGDVTSVRWLIGNLVSAPLAPDSGTVGYAVTIDTPLDDGTVVENLAEIDSDQTAAQDVGPVQHQVESAPILSVDKSVSDADLTINDEGRELTYGLRLLNSGDMVATGVVVTDAPPAGTSVASVDAGPAAVTCTTDAAAPFTYGPCAGDLSDTTFVRWSLASLTINQPTDLGFTVAIDLPADNDTVIPNSATFLSDQNAEDTSNEVETTIRTAPDLTLAKSVAPTGTINPGDIITYTLAYENTGSDFANNTVLSDPIPTHATYLAGSATGGGAPANGRIVWNLGNLTTGQSGTVSFKVQLKNPIPINSEVVNVATITADRNGPVEGSTTSPVASAPILEVTKRSAKALIKKGKQNTFFVNVKVTGNAPAAPLTVTDTLPKGLRFVSASDGGVHQNGVITWNLGEQNPGYSKDLSVVVRGLIGNDRGLSHTNAVEATAPGADPARAEAPVKVKLDKASLTLRKSGSSRVTAGRNTSWLIRVKNNGPSTARKLQVQDIIPRGFVMIASQRLVTVKGKPRYRKLRYGIRNGRVIWNIGNLAKGETYVIRVTMRPSPRIKGIRRNRAVLRGAKGSKVIKQADAAAPIRIRVAPARFVLPAVTG